MLRSLVGSEMCIRDSIHPPLGVGGPRDRDDPGGGPGGERSVRRAERRRGCLLYTSDAADDLLCVDLGGRRIIKKKNTRS